MSLSQPKTSYGIHQITFINRTNGKPYGTAKVVGSASIDYSTDSEALRGGSSRAPWQTELTETNAEVSVMLKEKPAWLYQVLVGALVVESSSAESSGNISALTNVIGTSIFDATTGIATITTNTDDPANGVADYKMGHYIVLGKADNKVDVYLSTDLGFNDGAALDYIDDSLVIAKDLTVTTSTETPIVGAGLKITGGSGTIAIGVGDVMTFNVRPVNKRNAQMKIGQSGARTPEVKIIAYSERDSRNQVTELIIPRALAGGMAGGMTEKAFAESDVTFTASYDSDTNCVFQENFIELSV